MIVNIESYTILYKINIVIRSNFWFIVMLMKLWNLKKVYNEIILAKNIANHR